MSLLFCYHCGKELDVLMPLSRREVCTQCGAYLRACRQCTWYAPGAANDCREPQAEPVPDKVTANFCDYFSPQTQAVPSNKNVANAKQALADLFKKTS